MANENAQDPAELEARLRKLEGQVDELEVVTLERVSAAATAPTSASEPLYRAVEPWVREHFARMYIRPGPGVYRWCSQWWRHAEAISRLESLWRTWEVARLNSVGMSAWYRDHLDHHLPILLGSAGPFAACSLERHQDQTPLPTQQAPDDWWPE